MNHVFLADDDVSDRNDFEKLVAEISPSVKVSAFENGMELMHCLGTLPPAELPSIIFLDLRMPIWDGIRTLQALKSDARFSYIPVLMWSITDTSNEINLCLRSGAEEFITKPTTSEEWNQTKYKLNSLIKTTHEFVQD